MRHPRHQQLLTLVVGLLVVAVGFFSVHAYGAPAPPQPDIDEPERTGDPSIASDPEKIETVNIMPVPKPLSDLDLRANAGDITSSEYFFSYRKSISPRVGMIFNTDEYSERRRFLYLVGFQFLYQTMSLKSYEAGLDVISNSTGRAHFARRWFFGRTRLRPYGKAGIGLKMIPRDGLATGLKLENWNARGAIGFENLVLAPLSFRAELELVAASKDLEAIASAGYSWAW